MENVVVLSGNGPEQAREVVAGLRRLHRDVLIRLEGVAAVERAPDGRTMALDLEEDAAPRATAVGGVVGAVVGLLTGPPGVILGGVTGAVVGSLVDVADVDSSEHLLRTVGEAVPPGRAAVIALVGETSPAAVDQLASDLGVPVLRLPRADVERSVAAAEEEVLADRRRGTAEGTTGDRLGDVKEGLADRR